MDDLYKRFDVLLNQRTETVKETAEKIEAIKGTAAPEAIKFSTRFDGLGPLCPSLIVDKLTGGYKKGRLLSKKPNSKNYSIVHYDAAGNPVYVEKYNQYGCELTFCFLDKGDVIWAVPFIGTSSSEYPTYVHRMDYENGRITEYTYMTPESLSHEVYTYTDAPNEIICDEYYYILRAKSKGGRGALSVYKNYITLQKGRVQEIKHYDVAYGEERLTYTYLKK